MDSLVWALLVINFVGGYVIGQRLLLRGCSKYGCPKGSGWSETGAHRKLGGTWWLRRIQKKP